MGTHLSEVMLDKVHVDYCGTCHGIFLDRGELEEAITAVRARERHTSPSEVIAPAISAANVQRGGGRSSDT